MSGKLLTCLAVAAALAVAACATAPPTIAPAGVGAAAAQPLPLRVPIEGVMISVIDFSSHGLFKIATSAGSPTSQDWFAAGLASLNLIGSATLITLPGTGDNDQAWVQDDRWRVFATAMQSASVDSGIAIRNRDRVALLLAADRLAEACQACHDVFRPDIPKVEVTRLASLP